MNISKNVIRDLLPVYAAGDASVETRALMEVALADDAELRAEVRELGNVPVLPEPAAPADLGIVTLKRTQGLLRKRTVLVGFCYFFTALTFAFVGRSGGLAYKAAATGCLAVAAAGWVEFLRNAIRLRDTGLQPRHSLWPQLLWSAGGACIVIASGAVLYDWTHWPFLERHSALAIPLAMVVGNIGLWLKQYKRGCEVAMPVETLLTLANRSDREEPE